MATDFSRTLSLLRQEAGFNQRKVSGNLGISQALLSHYETGSREPGLKFIVKAAQYYNVSTDYLLGRTMMRDGTAINAEELHDASAEKSNSLSGRSASSLLGRKLIVNSTSLIYDLLGRTGNKALTAEVTNLLGTSLYKIFRLLYNVSGENPEVYFAVPKCAASASANADTASAEARIELLLTQKQAAAEVPKLSNDSLTREYPMLAQSLLTVVHQAGERGKRLTADG